VSNFLWTRALRFEKSCIEEKGDANGGSLILRRLIGAKGCRKNQNYFDAYEKDFHL
jgi:hypothetical protein